MTNLHFCILLGLARFILADITDVIRNGLLSTMFLRLYDRGGNSTDEYINDAVNLVPKIDNDEDVVLYIPGYLESVDSSASVQTVANAYLNSTNDTIMALDYRLIEYNLYIIGVDMTDEIGKAVAEAIDAMVDAGIDIDKWRVIGFSLGAQIAGAVGGNMKHTIPTITGLDPAGPLFTFIQRHLTSADADFVSVIHGDMGVYGTLLQLGHADFYPNFGRKPQPGCPSQDPPFLLGDACSHGMIPLIYAATINYPELFIGRSCDSDIDFILGACDNSETALMGYGTPTNASGRYYLMTSELYPYGEGIEGASYP